MASSTKTPRVLPSGRIYRQMFDAETQLVNTLEQTRHERNSRPRDSQVKVREGGVPLVRVARASHGILDESQQAWSEALPYEDVPQSNPVVQREATKLRTEQEYLQQLSLENKEVRGLPDVVLPATLNSNIITRVQENRKERHEACIEEMGQELSVIAANVEPKIAELGSALTQELQDSDTQVEKLLSVMDDDEHLRLLPDEEICGVWQQISEQFEWRRKSIQELDEGLQAVEDERLDEARDVFQQTFENLEKIAYLLKPDVHRFMDKQSQIVNQQSLSNRRAYADLLTQLLTSDIESEKRSHTRWRRRQEDWRKLNIDTAVQEFRDYMQSDAVVTPQSVKDLHSRLQKEQQELNDRRLDLIRTLAKMKPPNSTKSEVYKWQEQLATANKEIDAKTEEYLTSLHQCYESVCVDALETAEKLKKTLMIAGVCDEDRATKVVSKFMLPLIGERQKLFEENLESMDKAIETHNKRTAEELRALFKLAQGIAHVWDRHEIGLGKQERALTERLDDARRAHDNENQDKEANLDIVLDRMRQDASEKALKDSLAKANDMLSNIRLSYERFHSDQVGLVQQYPKLVKQEVTSYDRDVCVFFMVDRTEPDGRPRPPLRLNTPEKAEEIPEKRRSRRNKSRDKLKKEETPRDKKDLVIHEVKDILQTARGGVFYVLREAPQVASQESSKTEVPGSISEENEAEASSAFLTEVDSQQEVVPDYLQQVVVPDDIVTEMKDRIRLNFLEHLEDWAEQTVDRANSVVAAKCEELNSELELRLHLHGPRPRRVEMDVHNVRAAELVMHGERVSRHCKGLQQALQDLKQSLGELTQRHNKQLKGFREDIEQLENIFINATKSSRLVSLTHQLHEERERFMMSVRGSLREFRQHLDQTLQTLRESNARFIKSFKLFSAGGNFCPEEVDEYRKRLEKMSNKMDSCEGLIMADLEGMEARRLEQATKIANDFADRFKHHMMDLVFLEKIARWLTNAQVKVKTTVADSNSQSQHIVQLLADLDRRIDACEKPNPDKETVSPTQLNDSLQPIFEAVSKRAEYINCLKRPSLPDLGTAAAGGPRVGFSTEAPPPPITKAGKQPIEDPSVNVIRNILKTQRTQMQLTSEKEAGATETATQPGDGRTTVAASRPPTNERDSYRRKNTSTALSDASAVSKRPSRISVMSSSFNRRTSHKAKADKRFYLFEDKEDEEIDSKTFLGVIKQTLKSVNEGLLQNSELYYKQKGNRAVTRPGSLQETFEDCAMTLVHKLQSYWKQAETYHNECQQELRAQLDRLEVLAARVPPQVLQELLLTSVQRLEAERQGADAEFSRRWKEWEQAKSKHQERLRPQLGHPNLSGEMQQLCQKEHLRVTEQNEGVEEHNKALRDIAERHGREFVTSLMRLSEKQLLQYDHMLTIDDVLRGHVEKTRHDTAELLRRAQAGQPLQDEEPETVRPRGRGNWPGIFINEFVLNAPQNLRLRKPVFDRAAKSGAVGTLKTTLPQQAALAARDKAYKDFKSAFEQYLSSVESTRQERLTAAQRWGDSWSEAVERILNLFKVEPAKVKVEEMSAMIHKTPPPEKPTKKKKPPAAQPALAPSEPTDKAPTPAPE